MWTTTAVLWSIVELLFYGFFHFYLKKRANQRTIPAAYREPFRTQRRALLERILFRILRDNQCELGTHESHIVLAEFLLAWFRKEEKQLDSEITSSGSTHHGIPSRLPSSTCYSDDETSSTDTSTCSSTSIVQYNNNGTTHWTVPGMSTKYLRSFFAWAFFARHEDALDAQELHELHECMDYLKSVIRVTGDDGSPPMYTPRRMTLEDVDSWHRPLSVYAMVQLMRMVAAVILQLAGFRFVTSASGLRGWVRRSTRDDTTPLVFFHGIAPGAILLYLPMVLLGMRAKNCVLIENPNISCCMQFKALSEDETVQGVTELVHRYFGTDQPVVLAGHSFGSCPISWLLNTGMLQIADIVLLDPVTILLSESDVMINFLYAQEKPIDKIRMVASSELFTEYYLRRHFAWYNSELWLEEHRDRTLFIGLAERDEIVNAKKVYRHASSQENVELVLWENVGHGSVVVDYAKWSVVRQRLSQSGVVR